MLTAQGIYRLAERRFCEEHGFMLFLAALLTNAMTNAAPIAPAPTTTWWIPIVTGGLAGALVSFVLNNAMEAVRRHKLTKSLKLEIEQPHDLKLAGTVENGERWPVRNCWVYVTITHDLGDILDPPAGYDAFIKRQSPYPVKDGRVCWSYAGNNPNPAEMNVYSGERQTFELLQLEPHGNWLGIFSEAQAKGTYRVFLNAGKSYDGEIRLVSADTMGKRFKIRIDPLDKGRPVKVLGEIVD